MFNLYQLISSIFNFLIFIYNFFIKKNYFNILLVKKFQQKIK